MKQHLYTDAEQRGGVGKNAADAARLHCARHDSTIDNKHQHVRFTTPRQASHQRLEPAQRAAPVGHVRDFHTLDYSDEHNQMDSVQFRELIRACCGLPQPHTTADDPTHCAFVTNPRSAPAMHAYGLRLVLGSNHKHEVACGMLMLQRMFDRRYVDHPMDPTASNMLFAKSIIGRQAHIDHRYDLAERCFQEVLAHECNHVPSLQLATLITAFPHSVKDARNRLDAAQYWAERLLAIRGDLVLNNMYTFQFLNAFNYELYYEADLRACMSRYYRLGLKAFPALRADADDVTALQPRVNAARPRIGIASAFFRRVHPVIDDFGGVLLRLDRRTFDIVFINVIDYSSPDEFADSVLHAEPHITIRATDSMEWLPDARAQIRALRLDLLLYLDATMSPAIHRLICARLAPRQAVSHGHPVTSGVPASIMNYYISWGAAELPTAQDHYTEQLVLLDANCMHQYYEPRVVNSVSRISGLSVHGYPRTYFCQRYFTSLAFCDAPPIAARWYVCLQKSVKRHPCFDRMLRQILDRDPTSILLLQTADSLEGQLIQAKRVGLERVFYLPMLPHHELIALYLVADVVLDSYYAGGCTTSREAMEVGAAVVTLPAKYLGGRWTAAYYRQMGLENDPTLVAQTPDDYVRLALAAGEEQRARVRARADRLFRRDEAVASWTRVLLKLVDGL